MLYANGQLPITIIAAQLAWSSWQLNRYFRQRFGLARKTYCRILHFRAAAGPLRRGQFFPEAHFADQAHFIREVQQFAGVSPKKLHRNENDRFIQFSVLPAHSVCPGNRAGPLPPQYLASPLPLG